MSTRLCLSFERTPQWFNSSNIVFHFDKTACRVVGDLEYLIRKKFNIPSVCHLYLEKYLLPSQESIDAVRDGDIIRVENEDMHYTTEETSASSDKCSPKKRKIATVEAPPLKLLKTGKNPTKKQLRKSTSTKKSSSPVPKTKSNGSTTKCNAKQKKESVPRNARELNGTEKGKSNQKKTKSMALTQTKSKQLLSNVSSSETKESSETTESSTDEFSESEDSSSAESTSSDESFDAGSSSLAHKTTTETSLFSSMESGLEKNSKTLKSQSKKVNGNNCDLASSKSNGILKQQSKSSQLQANSNELIKSSSAAHAVQKPQVNNYTNYSIPRANKTTSNHIYFPSDDEENQIEEDNEASIQTTSQKESSERENCAVNGINGHNGECNVSYQQPEVKAPADYSALLPLCGPPRAGDRIAYKVLEISASYTPEMSNYKEGVVLCYDPVNGEVSLELTPESLIKPLGDGNISNKFELFSDENDEQEVDAPPKPVQPLDNKVTVLWSAMVSPKLINT